MNLDNEIKQLQERISVLEAALELQRETLKAAKKELSSYLRLLKKAEDIKSKTI